MDDLLFLLQIIFGSDFSKSKPPDLAALPSGYSNYFTYIVTKVLEGSNKAINSIYPPAMHVSFTI